MKRVTHRTKSLSLLLPLLTLAAISGCASTQKWSPSGGSREQGVVRLSYEYPEYRQPSVSDSQADALALNRCNAWGYKKVEPIAGQVRQCANMDDGNCNLWTVTREYQCKDATATYASRLSR
jgi:hypothetical protein